MTSGAVYARPAVAPRTTSQDREQRLRDEAAAARAAESRGDAPAANEAWRRYRLVRDGGRDPQELLDEGIELGRVALRLARASRHGG